MNEQLKTAAEQNSTAAFLRPHLAQLADATRNAVGAIGGAVGSTMTAAGDFANQVAGYTPDYNKREAAATNAAQAEMNKRLGEALLSIGFGGVGLGILGTRLRHTLGNVNKPEQKYTKFIPGAHPTDDDEKIAEAPVNPNDTFAGRIGQFVLSGTKPTPLNPDNPQAKFTLNNSQLDRAIPLGLAVGLLGTYGGYKLMDSLYQKRRKEDLTNEIEEAKKDYERALIGKRAEILDRAFEKSAFSIKDLFIGAAKSPFSLLSYLGAMPYYAAAVGGTGLASGKMMYDWTRERSRDKALERARKSRARLAGSVPLYVDPEQLAAVKKLAE